MATSSDAKTFIEIIHFRHGEDEDDVAIVFETDGGGIDGMDSDEVTIWLRDGR